MKIDSEFDRLTRRHEAGDFVNYNEFGKKIFKQINGSDSYNRVDKINMNNPMIVSPQNTGTNHFLFAENSKKPHTREQDDHHK